MCMILFKFFVLHCTIISRFVFDGFWIFFSVSSVFCFSCTMGQDVASCCGARTASDTNLDRHSTTPKIENKKKCTKIDQDDLEIEDADEKKKRDSAVEDFKQDTKQGTIQDIIEEL